MIFNSFEFVLMFLPMAYVGFLLAHRVAGWRGVYPYLGVVSLLFYAQFSVPLAALLLASVLFNFAAGNAIMSLRESKRFAGLVLILAVAANLLSLGYCKYANFFIDLVNGGAGLGLAHLDLILPIGVSFYTFVQIGYLIEAHSGLVQRPGFGKYLLFATFFPCVTAGPLVLQREMFAQMQDRRDPAFGLTRLSIGVTLFCMGLFKKVILADTIAPFADQAFDGVAGGAAIDAVNGWVGSLCYLFNLYFDFSGYCDMAVGIGYLFGIKLPLNFNSPLKATSIADFWRRWHMTMTRFFTTFIYTPLAFSQTRAALAGRYGQMHRFLLAAAYPIVATFLVAGIWHGAGWTFLVYGLIHGAALAVNYGWREFKLPAVPGPLGWLLTMVVVVNGLVVFRAPDLATAGAILAAMWGIAGASGAGAAVHLDLEPAAALIVAFGIIVLALPNTQEILRRHWVSSDPASNRAAVPDFWPAWRPSPAWAAATALAFAIAVTSIGSDSTFLYYKF